MRFQEELQKIKNYNGYIAYHYRSGKYTYYVGYVGGTFVYETDKDQSMWSDEQIMQVIDLYVNNMTTQGGPE